MLQELSIRNFAIIDDLRIVFSEGLTVLSGETGAGKSIIINAVNLLLGNRATSGLVRKGADKAELEAHFIIDPQGGIAHGLFENDLGHNNELIIRRVISSADRHRIYINGRQATIQQLTPITQHLASISGQHANQGLLVSDQHLLILDQFGGLMPLRNRIGTCYHALVPLLRLLKDLEARQRRHKEEAELLGFQKNEIESAAILENEDVLLEQERTKLKHSAQLYQTAFNSIETLYDSPESILERLAAVASDLDKAARLDQTLKPTIADIENHRFGLEDLVDRLRQYLHSLETDGNRLEEVENRLNTLQQLKRKYGGTLASIADKLKEINSSLTGYDSLGEQMVHTRKEIDSLHEQLCLLAKEISLKRTACAKMLSSKVEQELSDLKMPHTRFHVAVEHTASESQPGNAGTHLCVDGKTLDETGFDRVTFMIAPNQGEDLKPLAAIASGGELSRVVLAVKAILSKTDSVETIVFDEVDAGIGGATAEVVGKKLASLAEHHQVICITHLPQIAKFGDHHFRISKKTAAGRTSTEIIPLDKDQRVTEIARMLGGETLTSTTLAHARELLGSSNRPKS
ncbi:MAG: DNA repair protein RecN [Thermodesulfobacteriota bacterium]